METLTLLDQILGDWKLLSFAFILGTCWYQGKIWFQKLTNALENTSKVHGIQNQALDNINEKLEQFDRRLARIEGSLEMIIIDNHQQAVRLSVIETKQEFGDIEPKRRVRKTQ